MKKMQICKFYRFATQGRFLARQMQFYEEAKNEKAPHEGALCCHDGRKEMGKNFFEIFPQARSDAAFRDLTVFAS